MDKKTIEGLSKKDKFTQNAMSKKIVKTHKPVSKSKDNTQNHFSKKASNLLIPMSKNKTIFETFLSAFHLDITSDEFILKSTAITDIVLKETKRIKHFRTQNRIFFILQKMPFYSFSQFETLFGLHPATLDNILKNLISLKVINKANNLKKDVRFFNDVLKTCGERKRGKLYALNRQNPEVLEYEKIVEEQLDLAFKLQVQEELKEYELAEKLYAEKKELEAIKLKNKQERKESTLFKLCDALIPFMGKTLTIDKLVDRVCFSKEIMTERKFKGKRGKYGDYSGGWLSFLIRYKILLKDDKGNFEVSKIVSTRDFASINKQSDVNLDKETELILQSSPIN